MGGGGQHCVIALDFPLEFAGFFPRKKSQKTRGKIGALRENSGKKYRIFPLLFSSETASYPIPTNVNVSTRTSPPRRPTPTRPTPPCPPPPGRLQPVLAAPPPATEFFPQYQIFPWCYWIFPSCRNRIFPLCRNSPIALMPPPCHNATSRRTMCPSVLLSSCFLRI